jgi:sodium-dependent dicarboxylate transporter 2/3/5
VVESVEGGPSRTATAFAMSLFLGIAYAASVGGMGTPVGTAPNQVFLRVFSTLFPEGPEISFGAWMLAWMPVVLLGVGLGWLLLTRLALRVPDHGARAAPTLETERAALGRMGRGEAMMATLFAATAVLWLTRAPLDLGFGRFAGWARLILPETIAEPERYLTDATVATAAALLGFILPVDRRRGITLLDWRSTAGIPWEVLLLIGAGFALAGGIKESGLDRALGQALGPLIEGRPAWQIVPVVVALIVFASEITSNTAIAVVLLPILGSAAVAAGISPLLTMMPAAIAASGGFMLPVSTPPNAIVFATGRVPPTAMARIGFWMDLLVIAIIVLVFFASGTRILGIEPGLPGWAEQAK